VNIRDCSFAIKILKITVSFLYPLADSKQLNQKSTATITHTLTNPFLYQNTMTMNYSLDIF